MPAPSLNNVYRIVAVMTMIAATYTVIGREMPPVVTVFNGLAPILAVGSWFHRYLRAQQVTLPYDFGYFFLIGWPVVAPVFAKRIRGVRTARLVGKLYLLATAPTVLAALLEVALVLTGYNGRTILSLATPS